VIFELRKPLYDWRNFGTQDEPSYDLDLANNVKEWLDRQRIKYDAYPLQEQRDLGRGVGLVTYLIFYIDVWDDKDAMLFKLTWL